MLALRHLVSLHASGSSSVALGAVWSRRSWRRLRRSWCRSTRCLCHAPLWSVAARSRGPGVVARSTRGGRCCSARWWRGHDVVGGVLVVRRPARGRCRFDTPPRSSGSRALTCLAARQGLDPRCGHVVAADDGVAGDVVGDPVDCGEEPIAGWVLTPSTLQAHTRSVSPRTSRARWDAGSPRHEDTSRRSRRS